MHEDDRARYAEFRLREIAFIASRHELDHRVKGDEKRRFETILSIATDGREGHDHGHPRSEGER
jgi:hypothetical protein